MTKLTVAALQQMKRDGKKIAAIVAHDNQMAQIVDRAGADLISIGDSLGGRFLGQPSEYEVTLDQMILFCLAVTRGVQRAVVSCDMPFGPVQEGVEEGVRAAIRIVKKGHAEMVKVDDAGHNVEAVAAIANAGIPVWAQFGFSPQSTQAWGNFMSIPDEVRNSMRGELLEQAKKLEQAGASMFDCTNVGNEIIGEIARTVKIPVLGGFNTGPAADGRVRVSYGAVGYAAAALDRPATDSAPNVARFIHDTIGAWFEAVRNGTAPP